MNPSHTRLITRDCGNSLTSRRVASRAVGADVYRELRDPMIDLVRAWYITLFTDDQGELTAESAVDVLSAPANWLLPWD